MRRSMFVVFTAFVIAAAVMFIGCGHDNSQEPQNVLVCDNVFDDQFDNLDNWELYGSPLPLLVDSIYGRSGVFDNNGDPNYNSGALSTEHFDLSNGFRIESDVYLDFYNLSGCWAGAAIGIGDTIGSSTGANIFVYLSLDASGGACWATPDSLQGHSYLHGSYFIDDTTHEGFGGLDGIQDVIVADEYEGGWHTLKIDVDTLGIPRFYIDDVLLYTGIEPVAEFVMNNDWPLLLGLRSSGSAGKAYHDWVKLGLYRE